VDYSEEDYEEEEGEAEEDEDDCMAEERDPIYEPSVAVCMRSSLSYSLLILLLNLLYAECERMRLSLLRCYEVVSRLR
jgi:hypothetical protein